MKKLFSIVFSLLMLTAMSHFSIAEHYCHGNLAASKVSLSGELASCGMEGEGQDIPLQGTHIESHCCDDVVSFYGITDSYTPSFFTLTDSFHHEFQNFGLPADSRVNHSAVLQSNYTSVSPPGALMSTHVDLADICVFRI